MKTLILIIALLLSGCASTPPSDNWGKIMSAPSAQRTQIVPVFIYQPQSHYQYVQPAFNRLQ